MFNYYTYKNNKKPTLVWMLNVLRYITHLLKVKFNAFLVFLNGVFKKLNLKINFFLQIIWNLVHYYNSKLLSYIEFLNIKVNSFYKTSQNYLNLKINNLYNLLKFKLHFIIEEFYKIILKLYKQIEDKFNKNFNLFLSTYKPVKWLQFLDKKVIYTKLQILLNFLLKNIKLIFYNIQNILMLVYNYLLTFYLKLCNWGYSFKKTSIYIYIYYLINPYIIKFKVKTNYNDHADFINWITSNLDNLIDWVFCKILSFLLYLPSIKIKLKKLKKRFYRSWFYVFHFKPFFNKYVRDWFLVCKRIWLYHIWPEHIVKIIEIIHVAQQKTYQDRKTILNIINIFKKTITRIVIYFN